MEDTAMKNQYKILLAFCLLPFLASCNLTPNLDMVGMFYGQSPRNNERFEESMRYNEEHGVCRTISLPQDEYKIYIATDMHVDSTWRNTLKWATLAQNDPECSFAIVLGDMINAQDNWEHFMEGMKPLTKTWFPTCGNHDIYFGQWKDYVAHFGTATYYFIIQTPGAKDLYICLDTSDGTLGVKQMKWLKDLLQQSSAEGYRHIIVYTHTHMFKRDSSQGHTSNFTMEETYEITGLLSQYKVEWYVSGHDHSREITDFKGVRYIIVDALEDPVEEPAYMIATIGDDLKYDFVKL